tara:strand:+ start:1755 stop:2024 length:270 start_codon:yes stop_codon:yes gene_type:complete
VNKIFLLLSIALLFIITLSALISEPIPTLIKPKLQKKRIHTDTTKVDSNHFSHSKDRINIASGRGWIKAYSSGIRFGQTDKWDKSKDDG